MHVISVIYSCLQNKKGQEHVKIIIHINLQERKNEKNCGYLFGDSLTVIYFLFLEF